MIAQILFFVILMGITTASQPIAEQPLTATVVIEVEPSTTRSIRGTSELDRHRYFAMSESGTQFEGSIRDDKMYKQLIRKLNICFGRSLGPVSGVIQYGKAVRESAVEPGHVDLDFLKRKLRQSNKPGTKKLRRDFDKNLNVVAHGKRNAFPEFMGKYISEHLKNAKNDSHGEPSWLPKDVEAAAELSAAVFKHAYDDFTRPRAYEPINEPHWSYYGDQHLADWHLATHKRMHEEVPGVAVGGPCMPVAYFYSKQYKAFNGLREFIENTDCKLDFYSFHVYDYLKWDGKDFNGGRVTSGLPLEGVLDLVPNFTRNKFKREVPIVISETGGYDVEFDGMEPNEFAKKLLSRSSPGKGFQWEMKSRSIRGFNQISANIANALTFMDHPHTVKKAVPFILLNSFGWDPRYNSVLYTPQNFEDKSVWVPTEFHKFYELFSDLEGRRVKAWSPDPDVQTRAFVSGSKLFIIANNLWTKPEILRIDAPEPKSVSIRRLGRNEDFTLYLKEESGASLDGIQLAGREAVMIIADYGQAVEQKKKLAEAALYGDKTVQQVEKKASFRIDGVPDSNVNYAILRVSFSRPAASGREIDIRFNGKLLPNMIEDCASRLEDETHGYATMRMIRLDPSSLKKSNRVTVSFPDGKPGTVGSVVMRVAIDRSQTTR